MEHIKKVINVSSAGLFILTTLSIILLSSTTFAVSEDRNLQVTVPVSCNLATQETTAHTAIADPGMYTDDIGESTLTAICNDSAGFAIYAIGYSNDEYGNNTLVNTTTPTQTIPTGTATSGATSNWAMKLTPVTGTYEPTIVGSTLDLEKEQSTPDFSSYTEIPSTYTKVAYRNSNTDATTGAKLKSTYATYIASNQYAGTYEGKVKYTLVHPVSHIEPYVPHAIETTSGQICYYPNTNEHEGTMGCQTIGDYAQTGTNSTTSATLLASNFSREGYGFAGWNTAFDYSGTFYGPQEDITFTEGQYTSPNNGLSLYAVWVEAESNVTMQTFDDTASTYASKPVGSVIALEDERDHDVYAVAKLGDGNWWMIENLRLDYDANITTSNTQSDNGAWGGVFNGLPEPETTNFSLGSTTPNSLYTTDTTSTDLRVITGNDQDSRFPRYNNTNTINRASSPKTNFENLYSYGNYYTWAAAIADTGNYTTRNQSITNTSLCPFGWHLPKGGNKSNEANNEFWNLIVTNVMNGTNPANYESQTHPYYTGTPEGSNASKALRAYPNNLVYSGHYDSSSGSNSGTSGYYWSSTIDDSSNAYTNYLGITGVDPGTFNTSKSRGRTVRCLVDWVFVYCVAINTSYSQNKA